jgi:hypothetical protein
MGAFHFHCHSSRRCRFGALLVHIHPGFVEHFAHADPMEQIQDSTFVPPSGPAVKRRPGAQSTFTVWLLCSDGQRA